MKSDREARESSKNGGRQLDGLGSFGFHGSMFPSIFGGKDPFDDPFFSLPHGSLLSSSNPGNVQPTDTSRSSKGPVIEELDSDDDGAPPEKDEENDVGSAAWTNKNPLVEHPEDEGNDDGRRDRRIQDVSSAANQNKEEVKKPVSRSVSFRRVTYGGVNGTYYSATTSRRTGNDGVTWEESKQANRTTGQAAHKVSRGINDKGHSVVRKLGSDGKVETVQTLQNLDEDEVEGFEKAWGGIGQDHLNDFPRMSGSGSNRLAPLADWGSFPSPFRETNRSRSFDHSASGRPKKVVTINIE